MARIALCILILGSFLTASAAAQKNKPRPEYMKKPDQEAIALPVPKTYVAAAEPCDNYAWAAVVETLLKHKTINITQREWVMKAYGGYRCISPLSVADYTGLLRYITGDYTPTPERKVRIEAEFTPGAPIIPDTFILTFRNGEPLMMVWKGKPYVWYGVVYDEYIHANGNRMFELRELKLLDPLAKNDPKNNDPKTNDPKKKDAQLVSFVKGRDDANQIDGVMRIKVSAR